MWLWHFLQRISISPAGFASCLYSRLTVLSGLRKLGHPVPASNLSFARKSGLPQAAQWYVPPFSVSQYRPENAVSMLPCRIIRYRSGFSFFLNSSSFIAPRVGFEPTINSLTGSCVTITLPGNVRRSIAKNRVSAIFTPHPCLDLGRKRMTPACSWGDYFSPPLL